MRPADLAERVNACLHSCFESPVELCGEIEGRKRASSGYVYFTLRDGRISTACVVSGDHADARHVQNGRTATVVGRLEIYRGTVRLRIERLRAPAGLVGDRWRHRGALVERLRCEGHLARPRRALPKYPRHLVLITSPTSAACADMREGIEHRGLQRGLKTTILASRVQGEAAPSQIVRALARVATLTPSVDVVVVGRGGGSVDDLSAFDDERIARAIVACAAPVVTAIGHETDESVADLVADLRTKTPTAAIDRVLRHAVHPRARLCALSKRLRIACAQAVAARRAVLRRLEARLQQAARIRLDEARARFGILEDALERLRPRQYETHCFDREGAAVDGHRARSGAPLWIRASDGSTIEVTVRRVTPPLDHT